MQPMSDVTDNDVIRVVRRDFPDDADAVLMALKPYGTENWQREIHRVRSAILKLSTGDVAKVASNTRNACRDYRDVLAAAEYPEYMGASMRDLPDDNNVARQIVLVTMESGVEIPFPVADNPRLSKGTPQQLNNIEVSVLLSSHSASAGKGGSDQIHAAEYAGDKGPVEH